MSVEQPGRKSEFTFPFMVRDAVGRAIASYNERGIYLPEGEEVTVHPHLRFTNRSKARPVAVVSGVSRLIPECFIDRSPLVHRVQLLDRPIYDQSGSAVGSEMRIDSASGQATVDISLAKMIEEISRGREVTPSAATRYQAVFVSRYALEANQFLAHCLYVTGHISVSREEDVQRILAEAQVYASGYMGRMLTGDALPILVLTANPDTSSPKPN